MNFIFINFILYLGSLSLLVKCKGSKKSEKVNRDAKNGSTMGANKKSDSKSSDRVDMEKLKEKENENVEKNENEKFLVDKTQDHHISKDECMSNTQNQTTDEKLQKSKVSLEEKKELARTKTRTRTRRTKSEEESMMRKGLKEAKTQCPEKSNSEELNSALRSQLAQERQKRDLHYPERSCMEEMNATLASECSTNIKENVQFKKIAKAVDAVADGELKPADVHLVYPTQHWEIPVCTTEQSEK
ncbi:hypothetical protein DICVIV_05054 [Dictyocaulus viviparus]|uniref:Uncharacterized protein n=1 Tax=Dictyocaulus viviparus TaxID=29172 RepID=A0A0D8Y2K4_DICVI|nr:hypothetical protein DICVIV_05054 [Dictyocaulus viviparus]